MPVSLEQEKAAIQAEEKRLSDRRKKLVEREQSERNKMLEKSVLAKLEIDRLRPLLSQMKALGVTEVEKRLCA